MTGYIILGACIFAAIILMNSINKNENERIFANPNYTIGEVVYYSPSKGAIMVPNVVNAPPKSAEIKYVFLIDKQEFTNYYNAGIYKVPPEGIKVGEKYLVVYLKTNSQKSRMLFDYPVTDSADFTRYMEEFKTNPPKLGK